jgi:hypothetical protein
VFGIYDFWLFHRCVNLTHYNLQNFFIESENPVSEY